MFDLFTFKSKFQQVFTLENFTLLREVIKEKIIEQVKKNIPGQEKMDNVVAIAVEFIRKHMSSNNKIVTWIIESLLIPGVRHLAQTIYDDLKQIVKGL